MDMQWTNIDDDQLYDWLNNRENDKEMLISEDGKMISITCYRSLALQKHRLEGRYNSLRVQLWVVSAAAFVQTGIILWMALK